MVKETLEKVGNAEGIPVTVAVVVAVVDIIREPFLDLVVAMAQMGKKARDRPSAG